MGRSAEEAKNMVGNRYDLVLITAIRTRELRRGQRTKLTVVPKNGPVVTAMKEIESGLVGRDYLKKIR